MSHALSKTPESWGASGGLGGANQHPHSASFLSKPQPLAPLTQAEIEQALFCIPSDCDREQWARIGMALKSEFGDAAFESFLRWSTQADTSNARDIRDTWRSIKAGGGIGIGSLLFEAKKHGWQRAPRPPMTASERAAAEQAAPLATQQREAREQAERLATECRHQQAAATAARFIATLSPAKSDHPYLVRKGVQPHGVLQSGDSLVIPVRDVSGSATSYQTITSEGEKRFLSGGRISGGFFTIGEPLTAHTAHAVICEGFATGASLIECHGASVPSVIVAFNAGHLLAVAMTIKTAFPDIALAIAADWDGAPNGGIGVAKATEAAGAVDAELWIPVIPDAMGVDKADFNDLHQWQRKQQPQRRAA
jgi:putative DNA primase/helicase